MTDKHLTSAAPQAEEPAFNPRVILAAQAIAESRGWVDRGPESDLSLAETLLGALEELDEFLDEVPRGIKRSLMSSGIAALTDFAETIRDFRSKAL